MNIPGENALNIMSSNEYLTRVNLMDAANPHSDTGRKAVITRVNIFSSFRTLW